jgi:aminoglycoside phosphotransferase (APT) family kinase protein
VKERQVYERIRRTAQEGLAGLPPDVDDGFLERLPSEVARETGCDAGLRIRHLALDEGRSATCVLGDETRARVVARVPLNGLLLARLEEARANLGRLEGRAGIPVAIANLVPRSLGRIELRGRPVFLESALEGNVPGKRARRMFRRTLRRKAADFLTALHRASREDVLLDDDLFEDRIGHYCDHLAAAVEKGRQAEAVRRMKAGIQARLVGSRFPLVVEHGDFHLGNCLFDRLGRLTGVIDWDLGSARGLPVLDLLHLLVTTERPRKIDGDTAGRLLGGDLGRAAGRFTGDYLAGLGMGPELLEGFLLVYVLNKVLAPILVREGERQRYWRREVVGRALTTVEGAWGR